MAKTGNTVSMGPGSSQDGYKEVSVRKIDNGYVRRETSSGPNGYKSSETFHKENPGFGGEKAPSPGPSSLKEATSYLKGSKK